MVKTLAQHRTRKRWGVGVFGVGVANTPYPSHGFPGRLDDPWRASGAEPGRRGAPSVRALLGAGTGVSWTMLVKDD